MAEMKLHFDRVGAMVVALTALCIMRHVNAHIAHGDVAGLSVVCTYSRVCCDIIVTTFVGREVLRCVLRCVSR